MVEMLKINRKFKTLVLSGWTISNSNIVGVNKDMSLYKDLFDALIMNKNSVVTALDISNNNIEDKGKLFQVIDNIFQESHYLAVS